MKQHWRKCVIVTFLCVAAAGPLLSEADTLARIRGSSTLKLGYLPNAAPFTANTDGKPVGYMIDVCERLALWIKAQTRLSEMAVSYVEVPQGTGVDEVRQGKIDLMCTPSVQTLSTRKWVSYSVPVFTAGLTALVRKDASSDLLRVLKGEVAHQGPTWRATINRGLSNHRYVVMAGGVTEGWIHERIKSLGVIATVLTVENYAEGVDLVAQKTADAFFADRMVLLNYAAKDNAADEIQVLDVLYDIAPVALPVDRQDEDFRLMVDGGLSDLYRSGDVYRLYAHYFGQPSEASLMLFKLYTLP